MIMLTCSIWKQDNHPIFLETNAAATLSKLVSQRRQGSDSSAVQYVPVIDPFGYVIHMSLF
eukprot:9468197-Pyramimonas_sp.AAC.1